MTGWPILHSDEQPAVDEYCVIAGLENVQITLFRWKHVVYFPVEFETWKLYSYPQKRFVRSPSTAVSWRVRGAARRRTIRLCDSLLHEQRYGRSGNH